MTQTLQGAGTLTAERLSRGAYEEPGAYRPEEGFTPVGTVHVYTPWQPTARPGLTGEVELLPGAVASRILAVG